MKPIYGGLDPTTSPNDFVLGAINTDVNVMIRERAKQDDIIYQKNQARDKKFFYTCTITSAILAICDLFNEDITDDELNKICEEAISLGLDPEVGWSFWEAVDCARRYWNRTRPTKRVISFKVIAGSREYFTALSYGYSLLCGYLGNKEYNDDKERDGIVGGDKFPNPTYSHCVRKFQQEGIKIIDNYIGVVQHNIYLLDKPQELQDNGVYYPSHYVFLRETDLTKSQIDRLEAKKRGVWNGEREDDPITRSEVIKMVVRSMPSYVKSSLITEESIGINKGFWNGSGGDMKCTRYEASQMIQRALGKEVVLMYPDNPITRGEMAELIVRVSKT